MNHPVPNEPIIVLIEPRTQIWWTVRIVRKGQKYGRDNCLTHTENDPLVEFYDRRYAHTPHGQFVSRYYASTLLSSPNASGGINLHGGVPEWTVGDEVMGIVIPWLENHASYGDIA